ncbi:MAG: ribonuclease J [Armatimonadetes bacterium]|nr:ribonuclease J [Armatimonadota bacterium]
MSRIEIMPLGGAGEIGRNCTLLRQGDDAILIDCGISFPDEEMHGVDVVIPDFSCLHDIKENLRAVILTHAHEDHVGALSFFLRDFPQIPVFATELTHAMIRSKLEERLDIKGLKLNVVQHGQIIPIGALKFEMVRITHSIPDCSCVAIHTSEGVVLFTGDFKLDFTPVDGKLSDLTRLTELGKQGVLCLLSDSTNIDRPGFGPSESTASNGFRAAFANAEGRILITMFASNIHRMQQAMDIAAETGRKVAVAGRRMNQTIDTCIKLGYLNPPKGVRIRLDMVGDYEPHQLVILTTGSQGEPLSALVQMSKGEYTRLKVNEGDTVIYSARPIPGNESAVWKTINRLYRLKATVVFDAIPAVHVSGHAYLEELKMMINLTRPFYLAPVHGEPRHQHHYCDMALKMGHAPHRMFKLLDGHKLIIDETQAWTEETSAGGEVWIDNAGNIINPSVVRDRAELADEGIVVVKVVLGPGGFAPVELAAKGFAGSEKLLDNAAEAVDDALLSIPKEAWREIQLVEEAVEGAAKIIFQRKAQMRPVVVPVVVM